MKIKDLLKAMMEKNASDSFIRIGSVLRLRIDGRVVPFGTEVFKIGDIENILKELITDKQYEQFKTQKDSDFSLYSEESNCRFRISVFVQRNSPSLVIRSIPQEAKTFEELNLPPDVLKKLSLEERGLVLLTGAAGSGKSTTIASMIEYINTNCQKHILTVEEPIEFTFKDKDSIINQRELGKDVISYPAALKAFTLQSPDVIFIGNIRDSETMSACLTAAETGVLVLSTLHTVNAPQTILRIINFFPPHQHEQIKIQLSLLLKGVISLRLIPLKEGLGRTPAYEVMVLTPTISRLIREGKIWEIPKYIGEGQLFGMRTFNQSLLELIKREKILEEDALKFSDNRDEFGLLLRGIKS